MTLPWLDPVAHNQTSINMVWTLIAGFMVMFMQLGFAMIETGLTRAKNAAHTFAMNLMIYPLSAVSFFVYGFAFAWGNSFNAPHPPNWQPALGPGIAALASGVHIGSWTILGAKGFFLAGCQDPAILTLFFFMTVFFDTTATIPTGAMAERWRWNNFCLYGLWVALPFSLVACWAWGGGWLAQLGTLSHLGHGYVDFAGSGVVHMMGGVIAMVGAALLGPRIGKFVNGRPMALPGHHLPMVMGGTLILAFGWFGFNPGSTLAGTDLRISLIVVNTMLASVAAALSAMLFMQLKFGKPEPSLICNGLLAGLVAITAPSAFVSPIGALLIGGIAGVLVIQSVFFFDNRGIDDPVGAISVHGTCGFWGILAVALFATGDYGTGWNGVTGAGPSDNVLGLFPIGSVTNAPWCSAMAGGQFIAQLIGGVTILGVGVILAYAGFKLTSLITPIRVERQVEIQGLDIPQMGALAYPDFETKSTGR